MTRRVVDEAYASVGFAVGGDPADGTVLGFVDGHLSGDRNWVDAILGVHGGEVPSAAAFLESAARIAEHRGDGIEILMGGDDRV